jgi:hypothetical protein
MNWWLSLIIHEASSANVAVLKANPAMGEPIDPINVLSSEMAECLDAIERGVWGTPCTLVLLDGSSYPVTLAWENPRYSDAGSWINPDVVAFLAECPSRMPAQFARLVHEAGESGMGYHIYIVRLSDGNSFVHTAGNLGIDLLDLPPGYTSRDVIGVEPHSGRKRVEREGYRFVAEWASLEYARNPPKIPR